jgi:hypothetical protein
VRGVIYFVIPRSDWYSIITSRGYQGVEYSASCRLGWRSPMSCVLYTNCVERSPYSIDIVDPLALIKVSDLDLQSFGEEVV